MNLTNASNSTTNIAILYSIPNPNLSYFANVVFTIASLFLIFLALSSNVFIIVNLLKKPSIGVSHHLIINLCLTDIIKCLLFFVIFNISTFFGAWKMGTRSCKILPSLYKAYQFFSVYILFTLAFTRYNAIANPFKQCKKKTLYVWVVCELCALCTSNIAVNWTWYQVMEIANGTRCVLTTLSAHNQNWGALVQYLACFGISHVAIIFFYFMIKRVFRKNSEKFSENNAAVSQRNQRNKKATRTILASVLTYDFILWPAVLLYSLAIIYPNELSALRECGELLQLVYSSVNPALFIWRNDELKNALKRFIGKEPRRI